MMLGSASASIGLVQLLCGAWMGALFSLTCAGALWVSVALYQAKMEWATGGCAKPPLGLWICRGILLGMALLLGVRILFL